MCPKCSGLVIIEEITGESTSLKVLTCLNCGASRLQDRGITEVSRGYESHGNHTWKRYDTATKQKILEKMKKGESQADLARGYGISQATISIWKKKGI